jgi:hypothetical protein
MNSPDIFPNDIGAYVLLYKELRRQGLTVRRLFSFYSLYGICYMLLAQHAKR